METERLPRRLRRVREIWGLHQPALFFLTICVVGRNKVLDNEKVFTWLLAFLLGSSQRYGWYPKRFVLMPDHLHLIAWQGNSSVSLGQWIKAMKAVIAKRKFAWQQGFFNHLLRSGESEAQKWEYIRFNPVRAGLVSRPQEWPYGGEIIYDKNGPCFVCGTEL
jgi:putative transposase